MIPNLHDRELVITDRILAHIFPFVRGEIIVYRDMTNNREIKIKRILGLPGEKIKIAE